MLCLWWVRWLLSWHLRPQHSSSDLCWGKGLLRCIAALQIGREFEAGFCLFPEEMGNSSLPVCQAWLIRRSQKMLVCCCWFSFVCFILFVLFVCFVLWHRKEAVIPLHCAWNMGVALKMKKWEVFLSLYTSLVCKTCWAFAASLGCILVSHTVITNAVKPFSSDCWRNKVYLARDIKILSGN